MVVPPYRRESTRFVRRIERFLPSVTRDRFFAGDLMNMIDLQEEIFDLQIDLQNAIGRVKPLVRKDPDARAHLENLRSLRWYSRRLGDALAWHFLASNRQHIDALSHNHLTPIPLNKESDGVRGIWLTARSQVGPLWGIPLVHDITSCLRVGDITFMNVEGFDHANPPDEPPASLKLIHRTIEVKTRRVSETAVDDKSTDITLQVTMIGNEPFPDLPVAPPPEPGYDPPAAPLRRDDPRVDRQLRRMDVAVARRDATLNAINEVDGVHHITLSKDGDDRHHWPELRRAIRKARREGYAFFSIDGFVGYSVHYNPDGITSEDMGREELVRDVSEHLTIRNSDRNSLTIGTLPIDEDSHYATEIMPFFLYDIPQRAMKEMLRHQLVVTTLLNIGRVEKALADAGFEIIRKSNDVRSFAYATELTWPSGEKFHIESGAPWDDVMVATHELLGLDSVIAKAVALLDMPNRISIEEFRRTWEREAEKGNSKSLPKDDTTSAA